MKLRKKDLDESEAGFFKGQLAVVQDQMKNGTRKLLKFNTDFWNNAKVVSLTGYSIEMLKAILYKLAKFIEENLSPNRLDGFDLEDILNNKDYDGCSKELANLDSQM